MKAVGLSPRIRKSLRKRHDVRSRLLAAVDRYAETGQGDVKALQGRPGEYRLRVGDWRIIFVETETKIVLLDADTRGDVYRR